MNDDYELDFVELSTLAEGGFKTLGDVGHARVVALEALPHLLAWGRGLSDIIADQAVIIADQARALRLAEQQRELAREASAKDLDRRRDAEARCKLLSGLLYASGWQGL